jgi:hypothetical protein
MKEHDISWRKCVDMCTDGTRSTTGKMAEYTNFGPSCSNSHCVLHQQALVLKNMQTRLNDVLDETVKTADHIKPKPLYPRHLKTLCEGMGNSTPVTQRSKMALGEGGGECLSEFLSFVQKCLLSL